jgi:hypothetical protein
MGAPPLRSKDIRSRQLFAKRCDCLVAQSEFIADRGPAEF